MSFFYTWSLMEYINIVIHLRIHESLQWNMNIMYMNILCILNTITEYIWNWVWNIGQKIFNVVNEKLRAKYSFKCIHYSRWWIFGRDKYISTHFEMMLILYIKIYKYIYSIYKKYPLKRIWIKKFDMVHTWFFSLLSCVAAEVNFIMSTIFKLKFFNIRFSVELIICLCVEIFGTLNSKSKTKMLLWVRTTTPSTPSPPLIISTWKKY